MIKNFVSIEKRGGFFKNEKASSFREVISNPKAPLFPRPRC